MKAKPLLVVLTITAAVNLMLTSWIAFDLQQLTPRRTPLPAELSESKRDAIFEQVKDLYNAQDYDGLYAIFPGEVQTQIPKAKFVASLQSMETTFGSIKSGFYSSHDLAGNQGEKTYYNLFYSVEIPNCLLSSKGTLKITVFVDDGKVEIYGIYLLSNAQTQ